MNEMNKIVLECLYILVLQALEFQNVRKRREGREKEERIKLDIPAIVLQPCAPYVDCPAEVIGNIPTCTFSGAGTTFSASKVAVTCYA